MSERLRGGPRACVWSHMVSRNIPPIMGVPTTVMWTLRSQLACLQQAEPARAPQGIRVNQDIEQAFDDGFGVAALALDAIGVSQRQHQ